MHTFSKHVGGGGGALYNLHRKDSINFSKQHDISGTSTFRKGDDRKILAF